MGRMTMMTSHIYILWKIKFMFQTTNQRKIWGPDGPMGPPWDHGTMGPGLPSRDFACEFPQQFHEVFGQLGWIPCSELEAMGDEAMDDL